MRHPPWIAFPDMPRGSLGWRMGDGEEFWSQFDHWYCRLQPTHRDRYAVQYPEPEGWAGFYARKNEYLKYLNNV